MGTVYRRKNKLWISYFDDLGVRVWQPTPFEPGQEKEARKTLDAIERRIEATRRVNPEPKLPLTVERYGARWLTAERLRGFLRRKTIGYVCRSTSFPELAACSSARFAHDTFGSYSKTYAVRSARGRGSLRLAPCGMSTPTFIACSRMHSPRN